MTDAFQGEEAIYTSEHGVRSAGVAPITRESAIAAVRVTREYRTAAMVIWEEDLKNPEGLRLLFDSAFSLQNGVHGLTIDWPRFAVLMAAKGAGVVRLTGEFDDPESSLDIIIPEGKLELFL